MLSFYGLAAMLAVAGLLLTFGVLTRGGGRPDPLLGAESEAASIGDQAEEWLRGRDQIGEG